MECSICKSKLEVTNIKPGLITEEFTHLCIECDSKVEEFKGPFVQHLYANGYPGSTIDDLNNHLKVNVTNEFRRLKKKAEKKFKRAAFFSQIKHLALNLFSKKA